jgi:hypothetical protein
LPRPADSTLEFEVELVRHEYKRVPKKLSAKERLARKKKAAKLQRQREAMMGEVRPDGSRVVDNAGFGPYDAEDDDDDFEL